jgi:hypothetical protein
VQQDRVAVRRGARHARGADHAAGAADRFDHKLLSKRLRHAVGENARDRVGRAARRERHDQGHRPAGIGLRCEGSGGRRGETGGKQDRRQNACEFHLRSSHAPPRDSCARSAG